MFQPARIKKMKSSAVGASGLAFQLVQDDAFRDRLLSAIKHGSAAGRRTRGHAGVMGVASQLATDRALQAELRAVSIDLQRAYERFDAKRRGRAQKLIVVAGLASLVGASRLWPRRSSLFAKAEKTAHAPDAPAQALAELSKDAPLRLAEESGVPGRSGMSKTQLIDALRAKGK